MSPSQLQAEVIIGVIAILRAHFRRATPADGERGRTGRQAVPWPSAGDPGPGGIEPLTKRQHDVPVPPLDAASTGTPSQHSPTPRTLEQLLPHPGRPPVAVEHPSSSGTRRCGSVRASPHGARVEQPGDDTSFLEAVADAGVKAGVVVDSREPGRRHQLAADCTGAAEYFY